MNNKNNNYFGIVASLIAIVAALFMNVVNQVDNVFVHMW